MLVGFGEQIVDHDARATFVARLKDVPIAIYEEPIPVHNQWPPTRPGLFIQWTPSYTQDAARAAAAGFTVRNEVGSHFKMLDAPVDLAQMIIASNAYLS